MLTGQDALYTVATSVLGAARARLSASPAGLPDRVGVVQGAVAWDDCECGQLVVAYGRLYLADVFPLERTTGSARLGCDAPYLVGELAVQVIRCAPVTQQTDLAPTVAALDAAARTVLADGYHVLNGTDCELRGLVDSGDIDDYLVRSQEFVGPEGACVGSELHVLVSLLRLGGT